MYLSLMFLRMGSNVQYCTIREGNPISIITAQVSYIPTGTLSSLSKNWPIAQLELAALDKGCKYSANRHSEMKFRWEFEDT